MSDKETTMIYTEMRIILEEIDKPHTLAELVEWKTRLRQLCFALLDIPNLQLFDVECYIQKLPTHHFRSPEEQAAVADAIRTYYKVLTGQLPAPCENQEPP